MLSLDKIYHAAFILKSVARKTDLIAAPHLSEGNNLYLKTENLQVTGSFKVRGAYYKISQLTPEEASKGVIACSAGNHAQGVALAATSMGIKSVICMPDGAPIMKVENTKRLGAQVELVPGAYDEAHDRAVQLQEETGMTFIHPYDDELVIAGQGSIGLEILDQLPDVEAVIVPIGGGGLISGVAFAIKSLRPEVKVYGVQAAGAASMYNAFHDHKYETLEHVSTFADGIAVKTPGENTYELISKYVDDIVTVSEDEIATAILTLIEKQKLIAEGAGATPVAAALFDKLPIKGKKPSALYPAVTSTLIFFRVLSPAVRLPVAAESTLLSCWRTVRANCSRSARLSANAVPTLSAYTTTAAMPTWPSPAASSNWSWKHVMPPKSKKSKTS